MRSFGAILDAVFPTYVGMNRRYKMYIDAQNRVPHIRGDEPVEYGTAFYLGMCSPHTWG